MFNIFPYKIISFCQPIIYWIWFNSFRLWNQTQQIIGISAIPPSREIEQGIFVHFLKDSLFSIVLNFRRLALSIQTDIEEVAQKVGKLPGTPQKESRVVVQIWWRKRFVFFLRSLGPLKLDSLSDDRNALEFFLNQFALIVFPIKSSNSWWNLDGLCFYKPRISRELESGHVEDLRNFLSHLRIPCGNWMAFVWLSFQFPHIYEYHRYSRLLLKWRIYFGQL